MSSIGSISSSSNSNSLMMQGMRQRPDAAKMAENLFSQLDTSGQGYIQKTGLQAAFDKVSSASDASSSTTNVDELFSALDTDGNGKVTKQEFTDVLTKLQTELEQQSQDSRMQAAIQDSGLGGMNSTGGMPPPPPPPGGGPSLSKDELTSMIDQIGTSDSQSNMMSDIVQNFDQADTDGDGKVSFQEANAFQQSSNSSSNSAVSASSSSSSEAKVMMNIMKLMQAYNIGNDQNQLSGLMSTLSVSA